MSANQTAAAEPRISLLGTTAILFEAPGPMDLAQQQMIWVIAEQAARWDHVQEAVPGMNNLMLVFSTPPQDLSPMKEALLQAWASADWQPGDLVTQELSPAGILRSAPPHIGIVADAVVTGSTRRVVIHNIGSGTKAEDILASWRVTGRFRWLPA